MNVTLDISKIQRKGSSWAIYLLAVTRGERFIVITTFGLLTIITW